MKEKYITLSCNVSIYVNIIIKIVMLILKKEMLINLIGCKFSVVYILAVHILCKVTYKYYNLYVGYNTNNTELYSESQCRN